VTEVKASAGWNVEGEEHAPIAGSKRQKSAKATNAMELPDPTERERTAIAAARGSLRKRPRPLRVETQTTADGQPCMGASHSDERGWMVRLTEMFGSGSPEFALEQLQLLMKIPKTDLAPSDKMTAVNSMLAAVAGVQPRNETEAALAVQMAATHHLAMTLLERAKNAQHVPVLESSGNMAVKLLRTYTAQVEALAKLRRGGNQTVRVEHVHVHSGGQAIVGNVTHPGGGGGDNRNADQPHALGTDKEKTRRLAAEPVTPVWSEDAQREPVPVTCGEGADAVPNAWWRKG
jgi:hypothetical protein